MGRGVRMAEKVDMQTTVINNGVELATYDGEKWFIKDIEKRKEIGVFGTYALNEWKDILSATLEKEGVKSE